MRLQNAAALRSLQPKIPTVQVDKASSRSSLPPKYVRNFINGHRCPDINNAGTSANLKGSCPTETCICLIQQLLKVSMCV